MLQNRWPDQIRMTGRMLPEAVTECGQNAHNFEQAANLGYRDVSSAYVFLQRTLGALQSVENQKIGLVSEVAVQMECAYEDIEAQVLDRVEMYQPRKPLSEQELQEAKQKFEERRKNLRGE